MDVSYDLTCRGGDLRAHGQSSQIQPPCLWRLRCQTWLMLEQLGVTKYVEDERVLE